MSYVDKECKGLGKKENTLYLGKTYLKQAENGRVRLCSDITINEFTETLYFEVDSRWSDYLVLEVSDCFVLATLERAMKNSWDIQFETPMSEELYYGLTTYTIPVYARNIKMFHEIELIGKTSNEPIPSENRAATGFSAGVDSFYSVLKHIDNDKCPNHNITHLVLAANGAASTGISERATNEWMQASVKKLKPYADELNLELIDITGNIDLFYAKDKCLNGDVITTAGFIYALQKLFGIYYWGSAYPGEVLKFHPHDGGYFEDLAVPYASTKAIRFYHSGSETNRIGKVRYIAKNPIVQKSLTVCGSLDGKNCGQCVKCLRTMAEINALGYLDDFSESFPVENYKRKSTIYLAKEIAIDHPPFTTDILKEMKEQGKKVPLIIYPLAYLWYRPIYRLRAKLKYNLMLRKFIYKFNLDELLLGTKHSQEERERKLNGEIK